MHRTSEAHEMIDGYTRKQHFFLSFAQVWRSVQTEAEIRERAQTNPHPHPKLRL